jgi:hypothetical protein
MPKLVPLSKRHRRSRQVNLCTLDSNNNNNNTTTSLHRTAARKVSEEDIHQSSSSSTMQQEQQEHYWSSSIRNTLEEEEAAQVALPCSIPSQLMLEVTNSMSRLFSPPIETSTETTIPNFHYRLKRPAPSVCLSDLALGETTTTLLEDAASPTSTAMLQ